MLNIAWYWWFLIVIGVVVIGYIKIKVGGKMLSKMGKKKPISNQKD